MLWLLPYFGYAIAASAVASAVGYAAVTRFSVVQRVLAVALDRALNAITKGLDGKTTPYTVEHTETGVIASGIVVGTATLKAAKFQGTQVAAVRIQRLEVDFPSLSRPMSVRLQGVRVSLQQMRLPEHVPPEDVAAAERRQRREDKRQKLEIVEELLWGRSASPGAPVRRWNPAGAYLGRLQAKALQKSIAFVAQFVRVELSDAEVQYTQQGEPGPRPCSNYLQGADAAVLHLRSLTLLPQGTAAAHGPGGKEATEGGLSSEQTTPLASPRGQPGAAEEDVSWWQALASIPQLLWSHVVTTRPSATKLTVAGVNLVLKTYPSTWRGYRGQGPQGRQAPAPPAPPSLPFEFTPGVAGSVSPAKKVSPGKRRRPAGAVVTEPASAGAGVSGAPTPATQQQKRDDSGASAVWLDYAAALQYTAAEEHVIFRQWEFSIMLCLLPPGYESIDGVTLTPPQPSNPPSAVPTEEPTPVEGVSPTHSRSSFQGFTAGEPSLGPPSPVQLDANGEESMVIPLDKVVSGGFEHEDSILAQEAVTEVDASQRDTMSDVESDYATPAGSPAASQASSREVSPTRQPETKQPNGTGAGPSGYATPTRPSRPVKEIVQDIEGRNGVAPVPAPSSTSSVPASPSRQQPQPAAAPVAPPSKSSQYVLDVTITLKALVPELNAAGVAILNRVVDRQLHLSHYGCYWEVRPQVPVAGNEHLWWQHAGRALAAGVRSSARREVPLSRLAARRAARLEYQALYAGKHAASSLFREPGRRWYHLRRVRALDAETQDRLEALEEGLSLEELAHFRLGVAATYNKQLAENSRLLHFMADKIDALVSTRREPLRTSLADLLLHRDRQDPYAADIEGGGTLFGLHVSISCPKIGIAVDTRPTATSPQIGVPHVVLALHAVAAELTTDGSIALHVDLLQCGPAEAPTGPIEPRVFSCPSTACQSVCKAAEFFRYAVTGSVLSESLLHSPDVCARMTIKPRYGAGGLVVTEAASQGRSSAPDGLVHALQSWHPAGFDVSLQFAAMGLVYNASVAAQLLEFAQACDVCRSQPYCWSIPTLATQQDSVPAWPPPLLQHPQSVEEMVVSAFATAKVPMLGRLELPATNLEVQCPGVAVQLPYNHKTIAGVFRTGGSKLTTRPLKRADDEDGEVTSSAASGERASHAERVHRTVLSPRAVATGGGQEEGIRIPEDITADDYPEEGLMYMFTVTVQNIRVRVTGEDFGMCFQGGTARRVETDGYLDVFSYLSQSSRRLIARQIMPTRVVFDPSRRRFTEEVAGIDLLEEDLREQEIASMAKVWAYPQDMATIMRAIRARGADASPFSPAQGPSTSYSSGGRSYGTGLDASSGLAHAMPDLLRDPELYPVPLIPYLKAGAMRGNLVQRLTAAPEAPGTAVSAAAVSMNGIQVWVSPMHIWHLISLEGRVRQMVNYLLGSPIIEKVTDERKAAAAAQPAIRERPPPRPSRRLLFTLDIDEVSLLWLIGTWTSKGEERAGLANTGYSRAWGITVKKGDTAYMWAQWLAPVYSASLARISAVVRVQASGAMAAGASIDGIILRDLQLPDMAKHAYVLRPLPARARRLDGWLQGVRRELLGISTTTPAQQLWLRAHCKILLRQKTSTSHMHRLLENVELSAHKTQNAILGPQVIVRFASCAPPAPGAPLPQPSRPRAELTAEVGQMLAYVRIKQQASMTAFATQLTQLLQTVDGGSKGGGGGASQPGGLKLQSGLRVDIVVVGIDVLFRVQSRDLMSLKLQQGRVTLDRKAITRTSAPGDIRMHVSAMVQDIVLQDMRAGPEHALVLIPNAGADYCSFIATYMVLVDSRRTAPSLTLSMQNPRFLVLFRFVADIMDAVGIIGSALTRTKAAGTKQPAPGPQVSGSPQKAAAGASSGAGAGADGASPAPRTGATGSADLLVDKPLEFVVQLQNVGIVVPTGETTRTVLSGQLEQLTFAMPGHALPPTMLQKAALPGLDTMLAESLLSNMTFKFSGFHDAPPSQAAPPVPKAVSPTEAEKEAEARAAAQHPPAATDAPSQPTSPRPEGAPDGPKGSSPSIKRRGMFGGRQRARRREPGVLFFEDEEEDPRINLAGVLHVGPEDEHAQEGQSGGANVDLEDNMLAAPQAIAKHVVGATKKLVTNVVEKFDQDGTGRASSQLRQPVIIPNQPRPESRESGTSAGSGAPKGSVAPGSSGDGKGGAFGAVGLANGAPRPQALLAICVEKFSVVTGSLVRVPNYFRHSTTTAAPVARQGSFIPPSLSSFSWPSEVYDVVVRGPLLHPANISMVQFKRTYGTSTAQVSQIHLSSTPLSATLSAPNYVTIMDFVHGNLNDFLHPKNAPPPKPSHPKEVNFNPAMKFGPAPGATATFRLTLAIPKVAVVLEAHPREWTDPQPVFTFASAAESHILRPFFHASASNLLMDLGNLPPGDTFINFCATSLDLQDLRLGYRLSEVSASAPAGGLHVQGDMPLSPLRRMGHLPGITIPGVSSEEGTPPGAVLLPPRQPSEDSVYGSPGGSTGSPVSWQSDAETPRTPQFSFLRPRPEDSDRPTPGMGSGQSSTNAQGRREVLTQGPHTGIRLSVARRLSEHSHRHRAASDGDSATPGTHGAPTPGRTASGGVPRYYLPVLDFVELPEVESTLGAEAAALRVLTAPHHAPPEERLPGNTSTRLPGSNPNVRLEVSVALLADSTTAVEVALSSALLQWPYFQDISLINSIANVFKTPSPEDRAAGDDDAPEVPETAEHLGPTSWLYVNAVLTETEFFIPVIDTEVAEHMARELWGELNTAAVDVPTGAQGPSPLKNSFQRVADLALATMLLDSTDRPEALALEERGLALSATVVRVAYASGGDGESVIQADLRELAAFIRDPGARANCILQPFSCSAEVKTQVPQAAEHIEIERLHRAASTIQRQWRRLQAYRQLRSQGGMGDAALPAVAALAVPHRRGRSFLRTSSSEEELNRGRQWRLVDELIMDVATPHTRSLLTKYKRASMDQSAVLHLSQFRALSKTSITIRAGALTARAAFSHIPFWQAGIDGVKRIILAPASDLSPTPSPKASSGVEISVVRDKSFRPHSLQIAATMESAAMVLCNDKPETFGAPDVLQVSLTEASLVYDAATLLPDRPANKVGRLTLSTYASFLNSGTSRWEPLYDLWPVSAEFVDRSSVMFVSDHKTNLWVSSDRHLNATFNPASLMSFGDALAFIRAFNEHTVVDEPPTPLQRASTEAHLFSESAPAGRAQASLSVTSRAPQKYLIQNQSGMKLYYWADSPGSGTVGRTPVFTLDNGVSETLRVAPATKRLTFMQFTSAAAGTERYGSVINMHFEGNWMPMRDVAVNVVGKYKYSMVSPADNTAVPVLVDIILVGRTKIITVHSGIWVENSIRLPISMRLHIPTTSLVPPQPMLPSGQSTTTAEGDVIIGPLAPKAGCYLPLTAALHGLLFVRPDGYAEAARDVIRLSTEVNEILSQQGYITCEAIALPGGDDAPLHMAMEATPSRVLSEFQAFKHMECIAPGTIQRATSPLEVTVSIQPTMIISNALPYEMRVLLWQVAPPEAPSTPTSTKPKKTKSKKDSLPAQTPGTQQHTSLLEMLSPRSSIAVPAVPRRNAPSRYFCYSIPPGGEQDIYVDMRQNVLMHVSVEEINMRSIKWSLCSWAQRVLGRGDTRETQYATRLPKEVQLRMVGVGMSLPTEESMAATYLMRLKDAGAHLRAVQAQFNRDARLAATADDIKVAVGKVKSFAKRMGKGSVRRLRSKDSLDKGMEAPATSARPIPPKPVRPQPSPPVEGSTSAPGAASAGAPPPQAATLTRVAEGGVAKKKVDLLRRWSGTKGAQAAAGLPEPRPMSPAAAGKPRSPEGGAPSDAPEIELVQQDGGKVGPKPAPPVDEADDSSGQGRRLAPPRPPPLTITESMVDTSTGMARTPFDMPAHVRLPPQRVTSKAESLDDEEEAEVRAPSVLQVGVYNSLTDQEMHSAGVCRITLYVPYWLNNRTGIDLFYRDKTSAPTQPLMLGHPFPWDYGEVFTPGTSMTEAFDIKGGSEDASVMGWGVSGGSNGSLQNGAGGDGCMDQAVLEYKLVLMNKQEELALGLAHVRKRRYSQPLNIKTVGNKGGIELRGPPAKEVSVPRKLVAGLATAAAAAGGAPAAAAGMILNRVDDIMPGTRTPESEAAAEPAVLIGDLAAAHDLATSRAAAGASSFRQRVGDKMVDVMSTQPGTMLVRMTSSGHTAHPPSPHASRRSLGSMHHTASFGAGITPTADADAVAALEEMQKLPLPRAQADTVDEGAAAPAPSREQLSEAVGDDAEQLAGKKERDLAGAADNGGEIQPEGTGTGRPPAQGAPRVVADETRQRFLIPDDGESLTDATSAMSKEVIERRKTPPVTKGQRLFEFAVDVTAAPPDSIYRHTKLVTLKPKYIIENQTSIPVDVKQLNASEPGGNGNPSPSTRFARTLAPGQRAAVYWDDSELSKELVVRPRVPGEVPDAWHWSGGFPIPDTEWYFGLRIRHRQGPRRYLNIPVNVTVGSSGSVQVTLKSPASVPPYRIENMCKDVQLYMVQVPLVYREDGSLYVDSLQPGEVMPYAWDEPTMLTKLRVQARMSGRSTESRVADFALDQLGDMPMMMLPTHGEGGGPGSARRLYRTLSTDLPEELKKKLVSLLAAEFSKKVYVTVYADGPTRVLRFSDEKNISSLEQQNVVLDLAARLKQVEGQLRAVNSQFARLSGVSGAHAFSLDLYGRMPAAKDDQGTLARSMLQRRSSKRLPLPEAAQALVQMASRTLPPTKHGRSASMSDSPSATPMPMAGLLEQGSVGPSRQGSGIIASRSSSPSLRPGKERQTVRFDKSVSFGDEAAVARRAATGVLEITDDSAPEGSALPYRHLIIRAGSEAGPSGEGQGSPKAQAPGMPPLPPPPAGATRPVRRGESRDWGHITSDEKLGAGSRVMAGNKSGPVGSSWPTDTGVAPRPSAVARRQELLKLMSDGDAVLLIGGDLNVTVVQARDLAGASRSTHPFARVHIRDPVPPPPTEERSKQTSVVWQTVDPVWDEQLLFRDVCAASELVVELWDLGGTKSTAQLNALALNSAEVIKSCRFLGRAEVPLGDTLDVPAGTPLWFPLMRRTAADMVSGSMQLRFLWDVTARGLLSIKLAALEQVLAQRREILAALRPVPIATALKWAEPDPDISSVAAVAAAGASEEEGPTLASNATLAAAAAWAADGRGLYNTEGFTNSGMMFPVSRTGMQVLARHTQDHNKRHLVVTVLEARGLNPRRGVVVALSANELPNPVVTLEVPGYPPYVTPMRSHTLTPRWPANQRHVLRGVAPASAKIIVKLGDQRSGLRQTIAPLGVGAIHASNIKGENPVYVWVPLKRPGRREAAAAPPPGEADAAPELQVYLRLQWQTEGVRGSSVKVEIDAAGAGLMVVGGLQDEIFNLTIDLLKATAVRTRQELTVRGTVARVQLDNQMLNAVEPVVLAPDASAKLAGSTHEGPLISFGFVRSFAGSQRGAAEGEAAGGDAEGGLAMHRSESGSLDLAAVAPHASVDRYGIRSFKDIHLTIAPLDFTTDEGFLEALLSFVNSLPTMDVWQDRAWQEQQRRLLTAQFGPREVESLAINAAIVPSSSSLGGGGSAIGLSGVAPSPALAALSWVLDKEAKDLEALHGQSDLSSWFFIENAEIGTVVVNVTVSLSSRLLAAGQGLSQGNGGAFNRALGASGFQLVNVSNVPITLGRWIVGNDPSIRGRFSNGFLSQRALASNLRRHYTFEALKEAHKVVGGAGPAVASVPLTVLWASGSAFVLLREVTTGQAGVVGALQQTVYVPMMTFSMFVSAISRMMAAGMAVIPPERVNGDDETVRRIIRRPNNSLEALAGAPAELMWGLRNALQGLALDPVTGWHAYHAPGFILGVLKGTIGLPIRPIIGSLEFTSFTLAAVAMSALGREGIVGKVQRRVRAPGAFAEDTTDAMEAGPRAEIQVQARALQAAWQRVLHEFFPKMEGDTVTDVINVRATRVVLITDRHVAYLRARHKREHSEYKAKWLVPIMEIQNIRGDPETRKITINHVHKYDLKIFGVWPVQKRKGLRCGSRTMYERTILRLTKVQQAVQSGGVLEETHRKAFDGANMAELTIISAPYVPPALQQPAGVTGAMVPLGAASGAAAQSQHAEVQQA